MIHSLPAAVSDGLIHLLAERTGRTPTLTESHWVTGGCINSAAYVDTDAGDRAFVKWNARAPADFFRREAEGLEALAAAGPIRVPEVLGWSAPGSAGPPWLALEYVPSGRPDGRFEKLLGEGLGRLHAPAAPGGRFGWATDNYIGSLEQSNGWDDDWSGFWRDRRLAPQLASAAAFFSASDLVDFDTLFRELDGLLEACGAEGPSLVHGDLWSGNVYVDAQGQPVLVDPAVYHGHREVDIAMSELFGGFGAGFYEAYEGARPLSSGYAESRRALYQLYPLLVHVNLFGRGYVDGARRALRNALGAV